MKNKTLYFVDFAFANNSMASKRVYIRSFFMCECEYECVWVLL